MIAKEQSTVPRSQLYLIPLPTSDKRVSLHRLSHKISFSAQFTNKPKPFYIADPPSKAPLYPCCPEGLHISSTMQKTEIEFDHIRNISHKTNMNIIVECDRSSSKDEMHSHRSRRTKLTLSKHDIGLGSREQRVHKSSNTVNLRPFQNYSPPTPKFRKRLPLIKTAYRKQAMHRNVSSSKETSFPERSDLDLTKIVKCNNLKFSQRRDVSSHNPNKRIHIHRRNEQSKSVSLTLQALRDLLNKRQKQARAESKKCIIKLPSMGSNEGELFNENSDYEKKEKQCLDDDLGSKPSYKEEIEPFNFS